MGINRKNGPMNYKRRKVVFVLYAMFLGWSSLLSSVLVYGSSLPVDSSGSDGNAKELRCPDIQFSDAEIKDMVTKHRASKKRIPKQFKKFRFRVNRLRCLYIYYEYELPEDQGNYLTVKLDPYGEFMTSFLNKGKQ